MENVTVTVLKFYDYLNSTIITNGTTMRYLTKKPVTVITANKSAAESYANIVHIICKCGVYIVFSNFPLVRGQWYAQHNIVRIRNILQDFNIYQ